MSESLPPSDLTALFIYFAYCRALRTQYERAIEPLFNRFDRSTLDKRAVEAEARGMSSQVLADELQTEALTLAIPALPFQLYTYASLYVVIEGWQHLGLADNEIDALLEPDKVAILRRFRNGVFHFEESFEKPKFTDFWNNHTSLHPWTDRVISAFEHYFARNSRKMVHIAFESDLLKQLLRRAYGLPPEIADTSSVDPAI